MIGYPAIYVLVFMLLGCAGAPVESGLESGPEAIPADRISISLDTVYETPKGVVYKKKEAEYDLRASETVKNLLVSEKCPADRFSYLVSIGPFLWKAISTLESSRSLKGPDLKISNMNATGKLLMDDEEGAAGVLDRLKRSMRKQASITIRHLTGEELVIHWAFIMFDIEDPIFIIETSSHKVLIELSEDSKVTYMDDLFGVQIKRENTK